MAISKLRRKSAYNALPHLLSLALVLFVMALSAGAQNSQQGVLKGRVFNKLNNQPLEGANVLVVGTDRGTTTNEEGRYRITGLEPGLYSIQVSYLGFQQRKRSEVEITKARSTTVDVGLKEASIETEEVNIEASSFEEDASSPLSKQSISEETIRRNPGANQDISNAVASFPGVASTPSFRNDLIIRGGAPNENSFYIDGIEVPNINHFATQGATGGPVGMINVDFIQSVDFYTGAFPVNRSNALSGVLDFKFRDGRTDEPGFRATLGASEVGASLSGPIGEDFSYIVSARRSYLQFLFDQIGLPFLPTYNDVNYKFKYRIDNNNFITLIGIGAIDNFELNKDEDDTESKRYQLNNLPVNEQWNYTTGVKYTHFTDNGFYNVTASRYHLNNTAEQYEDYEQQEQKILDYSSNEIENQFRFEKITRLNGFKLTYGGNYAHSRFTNNTFRPSAGSRGDVSREAFSSAINLNRWGLFGQVSRSFLQDQLSLSFGIRSYAMDYSNETRNPLDQLSPRFSASYNLTPRLSANFNTGLYHQKPPYTVLSYENDQGELVNKGNGLTYISSQHLVGGFSYLTDFNTKFSVEGFYKQYDDYPLLLEANPLLPNEKISLANRGGDFGVVGNAPADASSEGRSYGMELLAQQKFYKGFYGVLAYTLVWSEFTNGNGNYTPSSWDNRHIVSLTGGKKFDNGWELGLKWRFQGGGPYTPYDEALSAQKNIWDVQGEGIRDYDRINEKRRPAQHGLDVRIDKTLYFDKFNLDIYLDVQNAYNFQAEGQPFLTVQRNQEGDPLTNQQNPNQYRTKRLENQIGNTIPSIGVIFEM